jgi:hypothetical protein
LRYWDYGRELKYRYLWSTCIFEKDICTKVTKTYLQYSYSFQNIYQREQTVSSMTQLTEENSNHVLLYGDQTVEKLPAIRALVQLAQSSAVLRRFLRDACDIIQVEISQLRPDEKANIKDFDSLLQLAEDNAKSEKPSEIVATILMNVARLGEVIRFVSPYLPVRHVGSFPFFPC